ncbi:MAG: NAD(P)-dependent oxidoreductase, partial [Gammaproteobacteria bacterium]
MGIRIPRIVFLGPEYGYRKAKLILGDQFQVLHASGHDLAELLRQSDGLIDASMRFPLTADMILAARELKIISTATTGSDHIDRAAAKQRNIEIRTLREDKELLWNLTPAAEHTWALLLALSRNIVGAREHVLQERWERTNFPGLMLRGKTLGVIGCGRIGQRVASYGDIFGMKVIGYDPYQTSLPEYITPVSLDKLSRSV